MRLLTELQYRGIPDINYPDIDWRHEFAKVSALPSGVVYKTTMTGSTDGTSAFEGLNGGRINLTATTSTYYLRFDGWDLATPTLYRRALFEIDGLYFDTPGVNRNYFIALRSTDFTSHGVYFGTRGGGSNSEFGYCNGTAAQVTTVLWRPSRINRGMKLTIGVGYEYDPMLGKKDVIMTVNGKVCWRETQSTLSLAGTIRPSLGVQTASSTASIYCHGARLRLWRHRGS